MKLRYFALIVLLVSSLSSCKKDDDAPTGDDPIIQGKSVVITGKDLSALRFKDVPGTIYIESSTPQGQLKVESSQDLNTIMVVRSEGGELRIEGNNIPATIDLKYYMNPADARKIVVEGDNEVHIISTPILDRLELVTQGSSELRFDGLKVKNLISRREGSSQMILSSEMPAVGRDTIYYLASTVTVVDNKYVLYTENNVQYVLWAPQVTVSQDTVYAVAISAQPLRSYYLVNTHDLRNEGESVLDALEMPTISVTSKNEGKSESKVWATETLDIKGEGESVMHYRGNPNISKTLNGSAQLIQVN